MRITDVKTYLPWVGNRPQCLVKIETDDGIFGWGESGLSAREEAVVGAVAHYRDLLIGADPMARGAIWQRLYRSQYFEGGRALTAAQAAIDIALHDIAGKALGVPVYQLLGGRQRDYVPCFATTGAPMGPQVVEDAKALVAAGWDVIRCIPTDPDQSDPDVFDPRSALAHSAEWATRMREAVGPAVVLGIDLHHRFTVAEVAGFCQRMPVGTLDFLEEPIRGEYPDAYAQLRTMVDVPFAVGEEFSSKWAFAPYIERGLIEFARIDLCNIGGFTEAMKVAGWAETHYIEVMPHDPLGPICTAATAHLLTAIPNVSWMEIRHSPTEHQPADDPVLFPVQLHQEGPRLYVSEAPGLGIEVDEAAVIAASTTNHWNPPQFRRRDGSVQNW